MTILGLRKIFGVTSYNLTNQNKWILNYCWTLKILANCNKFYCEEKFDLFRSVCISLNGQCTMYAICVCYVFQSGIGIRGTSGPSAKELNTWMCVVFTFNQNWISGVTDGNILHSFDQCVCPAICKWVTYLCILSYVFWFLVLYF